MNEKNRGTGRTTAIILRAISDAISRHPEEVEVIDHREHGKTYTGASGVYGCVIGVIHALNLKMEVRMKAKRVFVRSTRGDPK